MRLTDQIANLVRAIAPCDALESDHQRQALSWITSGAPLFRTQKPATPPQHLVAYFAVLDPSADKLLLVDHKNAGLWLPSGGHVEVDEHPHTTVIREAQEELALPAQFLWDEPLFLTVTETVGVGVPHTDVSLWYLLQGDSTLPLAYDPDEFYGVAWFALDELPIKRCDPHLARFAAKLKRRLSTPG
ncbi:MAG: NUDIX domain-containing protein [Caldilineaceae bacterium]|nr:NUDIX domain-containing protein [Caldilineaceae bacterium]